LALGSGLGWTTGTGEGYSGDVVKPPGFAPAQLGHIAPEFGYYLFPDLILSLQVRFQIVTGAVPPSGVSAKSTAIAGLARAHYLLASGDLRPFLTGLVGGGQIRHVATFNSQKHCGSNDRSTCVDTIAAGPIFIGGGGGLLYNLSPAFALTGETELEAGFTKFTFNIDFNVGVAYSF
jgi:hypothetical protein